MSASAKAAQHKAMGERRFGRINWLGMKTLYSKEVWRFFKVYMQTLVAPVATAGLFMAVFTFALASRRGEIDGMPFVEFLAPGIVMMAVIQNAFANSSSSIVSGKVQGNIIDVLMPPLSPGELTTAYALGGATRGLCVAALALFLIFPFIGLGVVNPIWALFFAVVGAIIMALLGIMTGVWAEKFDHTSVVTNFIVTPLAFLSGTFYKVGDLPEPWATVSGWNPIHFLIDGFRWGILGSGESNPWIGAIVSVAIAVLLWSICLWMFRTGYRLKH
jgi:ABC-2 type transport system permease protein